MADSSDDDVPLATMRQSAGTTAHASEKRQDESKDALVKKEMKEEEVSGCMESPAKVAGSVQKDKGTKTPKKASTKPKIEPKDEPKKARKVFDKPGQTRETPGEEDPQRRFYTSLLQQIPTSDMAKKWCVMAGLLPEEDARKWVEQNAKKKVNAGKSQTIAKKKATPRKSPKPAVKKERTPKAKKKASVEYRDDPSDSDEEVLPTKKVRKDLSLLSASAKKQKDKVTFSDSDSDDVPLAKIASL